MLLLHTITGKQAGRQAGTHTHTHTHTCTHTATNTHTHPLSLSLSFKDITYIMSLSHTDVTCIIIMLRTYFCRWREQSLPVHTIFSSMPWRCPHSPEGHKVRVTPMAWMTPDLPPQPSSRNTKQFSFSSKLNDAPHCTSQWLLPYHIQPPLLTYLFLLISDCLSQLCSLVDWAQHTN